jgi:hypothetical protein
LGLPSSFVIRASSFDPGSCFGVAQEDVCG